LGKGPLIRRSRFLISLACHNGLYGAGQNKIFLHSDNEKMGKFIVGHNVMGGGEHDDDQKTYHVIKMGTSEGGFLNYPKARRAEEKRKKET